MQREGLDIFPVLFAPALQSLEGTLRSDHADAAVNDWLVHGLVEPAAACALNQVPCDAALLRKEAEQPPSTHRQSSSQGYRVFQGVEGKTDRLS